MTKHIHVDEVRAQEVAAQMVDGKNESIVDCCQCRDYIEEGLRSLLPTATRERVERILLCKYQMLIKAQSYREAVKDLTSPIPPKGFKADRIALLSKLPVLNGQNQLQKKLQI